MFQDELNVYFVFEQASKGSLARLLSRYKALKEKMPLNMVRLYAAEIVNAIHAIHSLNILHRDLKPENILFDDSWHVKLIDFGDAYQLCPNDKEASLDECGFLWRRGSAFVGTPLYVSPEMLEDSISSAAGDLWAFGCILYQMVVGHVPFEAEQEY